jgi:chromate transporter
VVGLLAAALWNPVLTSSVDSVWDVLLALVFVAALRVAPAWLVVAAAAAVGAAVL